MSSVLRPVRKRKKGRTLGPVDIVRREDYAGLELDAKVELIRSLVPLGLMHVEEVLDAEVTALAGERYARKDASIGGTPSRRCPGKNASSAWSKRTRRTSGCTPFLRSLVERGLDLSQGVLVILDGGKGLRAAVRKAFRDRTPGRWAWRGSACRFVYRGFVVSRAARFRCGRTRRCMAMVR